jgi:WD40-like Beta Propeller Repeat
MRDSGVADLSVDGARLDGGSLDAAPLDASTSDAGAPAICSWTGDFGFSSPVRVPELSSAVSDDEPTLSPDGLSIWITSARPGGPGPLDVWAATRASVSAAWGATTPELVLSSTANEGRVAFTPDALRVYVVSDRSGGAGAEDVWTAARPDVDAPFPALAPQLDVSTAAPEYDLLVAPSGRRVYFVRTVAPLETEIFTGELAIDGAISSVTMLSQLGSPAFESNPTVTADERVIVFSSSRAATGHDLYYALRSSPSAPFGEPVLVPNVNGALDDSQSFLTADGCELWFASERAGTESRDIFVARYVDR